MLKLVLNLVTMSILHFASILSVESRSVTFFLSRAVLAEVYGSPKVATFTFWVATIRTVVALGA